ncbi:MAG: NAD(P)/FAD-dependent oxidoreductase [Candidatus Eisenbacteria bacterium]
MSSQGVDVAIIGAGPAGSSAAMPVAKTGRSVLIIEREQAQDVGRKVCGNAIAADGLDPVSEHVRPPSGPEVAARLQTGTLYVHGESEGVRLPAPGVVLNRLVFGQRLLADALAEGARLADSCTCVGWSDRGDTRIRVRSAAGEDNDIRARVVIDASGYRSVLTRGGGPSHADRTTRSEVGVGYREILTLPEPMDESADGFVVFFPAGAERGYAWVFPMGGRLANVGIGTTLENVKGNLRDAYRTFVSGRPELAGAQVVSSGAGMLPLRRPLASVVGDGFMAAGDAGCQTSPIHGGGIAPAIAAGVMAGEQAVEALSNGDTSADSLWGYGVRVMERIGKYYGAHEVLRDLVYSLSGEELLFLARRLAASGRIIETIHEGSLLSSVGQGIRLLVPFAGRPGLAARVISASRRMAAVRDHYVDYPDSPAKLGSWLGRAEFLRRNGGAG